MAGFGRKATVTLQRNGDLVTNTYLRVTLPGATSSDGKWAWTKQVGHALVSSVELNIGGTKIDKHYSDWFNIWTDLTNKVGQARGYAKLIGDTDELCELTATKSASVLYVPLQFFFNRNAGLALPLIALGIVGQKSTPLRTFELCSKANRLGSQCMGLS